jgi:hypothetical protein
MGTRRNIGGRYVEVRERNTNKGNKGTILKNWSSKQNTQAQESKNNIWKFVAIIFAIAILLLLIYLYYITNM